MNHPNLKKEKKLWRKGFKRVAGLDEAGRGALCGPVVAAAVTIKKFSIFNLQFSNIRDSKKLTPKKREEFYKILIKHPNIKWGIGRVSEKAIDKINILEATKLAMKRAIKSLEKKFQKSYLFIIDDRHLFTKRKKIDFLIIDGNFKLNLPIPQKSIVKADEKVFSCSAASVIAKVTRDRIMQKLHKKYPQYRFDKHKGYPTLRHLRILKKYGPCQIHRKTFGPVKATHLNFRRKFRRACKSR